MTVKSVGNFNYLYFEYVCWKGRDLKNALEKLDWYACSKKKIEFLEMFCK